MADNRPGILFTYTLLTFLIGSISSGNSAYVGKFIGKLSELHHGVSGEVYAVNDRTLHIKDFTYDGEGPAAYFYVGSAKTPSAQNAYRVKDELDKTAPIKRYRKKSITLSLPEGKNLNNINWFFIWCDEYAVNFGDVKIPRNFDYPKPQKVAALNGVHGISSDQIVLVDAQTILIPHLSYDGEAPDAKFWVGNGAKPSPRGIRVPDENGKEIPLRRYDRKTVVLTLPGDLTVFDIGHFGIWCEAFTVDFGHIRIPQGLNVPPSLKMLGISPQSKLNCEVLNDEIAFEVRWAVAGDSIVLQLVAKIDDGDYMSFGLSGNDNRLQMIDADVVVAWVDKDSLKGYAVDYFLQAKSQCSGPTGSCPDEKLSANTNNVRLLNAAMVNGYSIVTYQRPLKPSDEFDKQIYTNQSQAIVWATGPLNEKREVSFHTHYYLKKNNFIDFGRTPKWNCPLNNNQEHSTTTEHSTKYTQSITEAIVETTTRSRNNERRRGGSYQDDSNRDRTVSNRRQRPQQQQTSETVDEVVEERPTRRRGSNRQQPTTTTTEKTKTVPPPKSVSHRNAWYIPPIQCFEPEDGVFYAQMGPTGGKRGYPAITGHVGWGISWYINGLLIPEINVVRGKQYTFVVEGGLDPDVPAKYHPFYITDDPIGGYAYKTPEEKQNIRIFAGARQTREGSIIPTGVGRLCHWTHTGDMEADDFPSFGAFQRTLELRCDNGEPGVISWTPDENTPDTVYYQCFTHRHLGWKINVHDACDAQPEASSPEISLALPEHVHDDKEIDGDLKTDQSIIIESRIKPNDIFQTTRTKTDDSTTEHRPQNDSTISQKPLDRNQYDVTEKPTDISYVYSESETEKPNQTETITENPTVNTQDIPDVSNQTRDTLLESPNNQDPMELMSMMFPAGRLPLEPEFANFPPRRPLPPPKRPIYMNKPIYVPIHRPQSSYKKPFYRPTIRRGPIIRPIPHVHPTNSLQNTLALTQEPVLMLPPPKSYLNISSTTPISQPTTTDMPKLRPAINTGFHPESVVIESGFKPIINKEFEKRISEVEEEPSDDVGVIKTVPENQENSQTLTETFEPMFIPSPLDSHSIYNKKQNLSTKFFKRRYSIKKNPQNVMVIVKEGRSVPREIDEEDDMVMAAQQLKAYYLPPDDKKIKSVNKVKTQSNIDIPPGTVVTFDGKTVSGSSLTGPVSLPSSFKSRSNSDLIRLSPQFGPFRGEKPPLNPRNVNVASIAQLGNHGAGNRNLNVPESKSGSQTTRLSPIRLKRSLNHNIRNKRSPHHTPEHTLEQKKELPKLAKKVIITPQEAYKRSDRVSRSPHHTPEHTTEHKREQAKLAKKVILTAEEAHKRTDRVSRSPHHTPEHTAEQKKQHSKLAKKVTVTPEQAHKRSDRVSRSPHHTPEHTAEQKREGAKLAKKVILTPEAAHKRRDRVSRSPHHTPEHTAEQKRQQAKLAKKVKITPEKAHKRTGRISRSPHHTPEHTAEQKRQEAKLAKKVILTPEEAHKRADRFFRSPHHTPEHTAEQKREGAKLAKKVILTPEEAHKRTDRVSRNPHHSPEHTAEQKRQQAKLAKKVKITPEETHKRADRISRSPHHTPEHTAEQKREQGKLAKKVTMAPEETHKRSDRVARSPHHTPEHTAEQKREQAKLAKKVILTAEEAHKRTDRVSRSPHHTPEHTAEQKREKAKLAKKVTMAPEETHKRSDRVARSPHHTPEHTAEQKREQAKLAKKVTITPEEANKRADRVSRSSHHTPEHTAEQKREGVELSKKVTINVEEAHKRSYRIARSPHHTPEHTAEQKREGAKLAKKVILTPREAHKRIDTVSKNPHHTLEHTAEQKREGVELSKKVTINVEEAHKRSYRIARSPHHTPEIKSEEMQKNENIHDDHDHYEEKSNANILQPLGFIISCMILLNFL